MDNWDTVAACLTCECCPPVVLFGIRVKPSVSAWFLYWLGEDVASGSYWEVFI